jgi:DNA repair protein RecN (Recombination protein N)
LRSLLHRRDPFADVESRLAAVLADLDDLTAEVRSLVERIDEDPERLQSIRERRQLLKDLQRKYGDDVSAMIAFRDSLVVRIDELTSHEIRAAALEVERAQTIEKLRLAASRVKQARAGAAGPLAAAIEKRLSALAMPKAKVSVSVGTAPDKHAADDGSDVCFLLAANPGAPLLPLAKVASGGELARTMLALRLALLEGRVSLGAMPDTLVFDEVDAGIGGAAATAVGQALAELGTGGQVLVVTHLAQVAARADHHLVVTKAQSKARTTTTVTAVEGDSRIAEVARMLGGSSTSEAGRQHAAELLSADAVRASRPRSRGGKVKSRG